MSSSILNQSLVLVQAQATKTVVCSSDHHQEGRVLGKSNHLTQPAEKPLQRQPNRGTAWLLLWKPSESNVAFSPSHHCWPSLDSQPQISNSQH